MFAIIFLVVVVLLAVLYIKSRGKYAELFQSLDQKEFPLKDNFMPMGYAILLAVNYQYRTPYDHILYKWVMELYGFKNARHYLQIFWAHKLGYLLLGVFIISFLLMAVGEIDFIMVVFSLAVLIGIFLAPDNDLKNKIERKKIQVQLDFPDFLNKLILLINAGMTVTKAWEKIATSNKKATPLYEEIELVMHEIRSGKPEFQAYEDFARRCRIPEITRFTAVVLQNMKKGNSELVSVLRLQASECWEMRKNAAKRLGEEASTKLLLPMMLMFVAILLIVALPAIIAINGL